jgi:hypothetical protein
LRKIEEPKTAWSNGSMAVSLKNLEAERLLKEAATRAFSERLTRLKAETDSRRGRQLGSLVDLIEEARAQPVVHDARPLKQIRDELWGEP